MKTHDIPELWQNALNRSFGPEVDEPATLHAVVHQMWDEIKRLRDQLGQSSSDQPEG